MSEQRDFVLARAGVALSAINSLAESVTSVISTLAVGEGGDAGELLEQAMDETHIVATALGQAQTSWGELSNADLNMSEDDLDGDDDGDGDEDDGDGEADDDDDDE